MDLGFLNGLYYIKTESMLNEDDFNALKRLQKSLFFKYLKTRNYGYGSSYVSLDNVILFEKKNAKNEVLNDMKDDFLVNMFNVFHDATNIKLIYKSVKYDLPIILYDRLGRFDQEALEQFFKYGNTKLLPKDSVDMFLKIQKIQSDDDHFVLQEIEKIIFNSYEELVLKNKKIYKPLYTYIQLMKVLTNVKTLLKLKVYETNIENFKHAMLDENIVGISKFEYMYEASNNELLERLYIYFNKDISDSFNESLKEKDIKRLDEALHRYFDDKVKELSRKDNTIAPILYYLHLKENETLKVRGLYYDK